MKHPIMSVSRARKWLKAVVSLREYYEGKNGLWEHTCPLCPVKRLSKKGCEMCLWYLFEGEGCSGGDRFNVEWRRTHRPPGWTSLAIPRLKRWERKLKRIIGAGK